MRPVRAAVVGVSERESCQPSSSSALLSAPPCNGLPIRTATGVSSSCAREEAVRFHASSLPCFLPGTAGCMRRAQPDQALCAGLRPIGSHPALDTWSEPSRARDGTPAARDRGCFHVPKPPNLSNDSSHSRATTGRIRHRITHARARHCRFEDFSPSSAPVRGASIHSGHESTHSRPESARHSAVNDQHF